MRNFEQRKAEVFRRSKERIQLRRKQRNCILAFCIPLCLILTVWSAELFPKAPGPATNGGAINSGNLVGNANGNSGQANPNTPGNTAGDNDGLTGNTPGGVLMDTVDNFSFSLVWGCYGISSYDSETGKLVKTTDATNPEDYITTLQLSGAQQFEIWELIWDLDIEEYPDEYDPHKDGLISFPSMTLILTVRTDDYIKTVRAEDIALTFETTDAKGQKFLTVCKAIEDILTATDEWNALPEYEHFYD